MRIQLYLGNLEHTVLGTWNVEALPRVGEYIELPDYVELNKNEDARRWIVEDVCHDLEDNSVHIRVSKQDRYAYSVLVTWSPSVTEPPWTLPEYLECEAVPRMGEVISFLIVDGR